VRSAINHGINARGFRPLPVGARSRTDHAEGGREAGEGLQITEQYTAEIEGGGKPACVAEVVIRLNLIWRRAMPVCCVACPIAVVAIVACGLVRPGPRG
jgi:hypothetical protein